MDEMKLSLALSNLVENAIKYNVEGGWVRVTLDADHKFFLRKGGGFWNRDLGRVPGACV